MVVGGVDFTGIGKTRVSLLPFPREQRVIGVGGGPGVPPNQQLNLTELAESIPGKLTAGSRLGLL